MTENCRVNDCQRRPLVAEIEGLKALNAELVEALEALVQSDDDDFSDSNLWDKARAAVANAKKATPAEAGAELDE